MARRGSMVLLLLAGCARTSTSSTTPTEPERGQLTASRIYTAGEVRFAAGHYDQAVELWRHAIRELPNDAHDLRHALVLRLAYGQLMAWDQTASASYLLDAREMLERHVAQHEATFGESERALAQRGEVYELLYQVEKRLEPAGEGEAVSEEGDAPEAEASEGGDEPTVLASADDDAADDAEADASDEAVDADEAYAEDGEFRREIVVGRERPSVDDPKIRQLLRSAFSDPEAGLVLTKPGFALIHGPRPLLRADGFARPASGEDATLATRQRARKLGTSLLRAARPALKTCYEAAFARDPVAVARSTVEVTIDERGRVHEAEIVAGGLVDILGDLCMVGQLEGVTLAAADMQRIAEGSADRSRIRMPLTFFYQGPVVMGEATGRSAPVGVTGLEIGIPSVDQPPPDPAKPQG